MQKSFPEPNRPAISELRHKVSGPLTSIILNCELLLEADCTPGVQDKVETILAKAMEIASELRRRE